ncbi:hypothetical protein Goe16_01350 [Bacillus phage vB_BsuM-Goe16]|nr:hypothetical protein Goe16_01350 [Bacillus phage vB_BsuM-Goe16]
MELNKKSIVYSVVYVGVAFAFPALPAKGVIFIIDILVGIVAGSGESIKNYMWESVKPDSWFQFEGPLWHILGK